MRAAKVIPCGISGHFSPAPLVPPTSYPFYAESGSGAHFTDVDGNDFIDYMCAYGPDGARLRQQGRARRRRPAAQAGRHARRCPSPVMVELAEKLVD